MSAIGLATVERPDPLRRALTFAEGRWLFADMKVKSRHTVSSRAKARNGRRVSTSRLPSFADAVKRLSGIMEGAPDLSSREGFGPTKVSR